MNECTRSVFRCTPLALALSCIAALGAPATAQDSEPTPAEPESSEITLSLRASASHTFRADLDNDGGGGADVSVTRAGAGIGVDWAPADRLRLSFALDNEFSWYDFSGTAGNAFDDLFSEGVEHELSVRASWILDGGNTITALGS
ncbi:MAG: hypothetical protein KDA30_13975, partial [Phycisphaerales bacterium]|nr:hypothetical protein [Phycisphaerales bacterium]